MRGKDFNAGLRGVLFEARHHERMGSAIWLYGWLVLRQTHQQGTTGWVLGGAPVSYREIEEETGFNCRTLERWMRTLREYGYIETEAAPAGVIVRITKAKKFPQAGRKLADGVRRFAGGSPQRCVAERRKRLSNESRTDGIGSSSIAGSQERTPAQNFSTNFKNQNANQGIQKATAKAETSGLGQTQSARPNQSPNHEGECAEMSPRQFFAQLRMRQQLLRAEQEEAVRRELAVGTNPEVRRP